MPSSPLCIEKKYEFPTKIDIQINWHTMCVGGIIGIP